LTKYGIESYIAAPLLRSDGSYFGTLCALDPDPADLTQEHLDLFELLSKLISRQIEVEDDLATERADAEARERLIGILGHDLRTPLTAAMMGAEAIATDASIGEDARQMAISVHASARRAARMVTDLLDFARARLAGGIPIQRSHVDLERVLTKVVQEVRASRPANEITVITRGDAKGFWDGDRSAQLISNLINNAMEHGEQGEPIVAQLSGDQSGVTLEVTNRAQPISPDEISRMFSPYQSGTPRDDGHLGLGLYIVQQIIHAHGGSVEALGQQGQVSIRAHWPRPH
jgi:signal transduction histidine kinase